MTDQEALNLLVDGSADNMLTIQEALNALANNPPAVVSSTNNSVVRPINATAFQPSTTKSSVVKYTIQIAATLSLVTGQSGTAFLETSPNNATWTEVTRFTNGNTGSLTIGLNLTQTITGQLDAYVPPTYWCRIRTTGNATVTYLTGQEILY
jgi:hypothetical protein